ncbi:MAG TPA: hypothetical protein VJV39_22315 [Dongiaceae bacterium]|nr:hypothetical protein [Dongiaceae bacterium]
MNRIALFGFVAALSGLTLAVPGADARIRSVLHGAMDICKINGDSWVDGGVETCCVDEEDIPDEPYCVVCVVGTESCYMEDGTARTLTPAKIKEMLKHTPKQGTVTPRN